MVQHQVFHLCEATGMQPIIFWPQISKSMARLKGAGAHVSAILMLVAGHPVVPCNFSSGFLYLPVLFPFFKLPAQSVPSSCALSMIPSVSVLLVIPALCSQCFHSLHPAMWSQCSPVSCFDDPVHVHSSVEKHKKYGRTIFFKPHQTT